MASHEDFPNEDTAPEPVQSLSDEPGDEGAQVDRTLDGLVEQGQDLLQAVKPRQVIVAAVAVGAVAAAAIGAKIAYDRRKSEKVYTTAVHQLEDARDALVAAASELPERSRAVLHRVTHR
ncbi:hypothetical protein L0U85_04795 [Glycomyces sp. L485]|uniref:hypothetical protein n=1 Tax=Glycomyces sp. L485 TaxID=2909235 RepID=UPI001F4BC751|nr:hypothetical protein [Glycomyces sp. L485]MCH7230183.1 hypothetical protein [Glycomyces sp. L485]